MCHQDKLGNIIRHYLPNLSLKLGPFSFVEQVLIEPTQFISLGLKKKFLNQSRHLLTFSFFLNTI